ncbi:hypothetical protein G6F60_014163 [Rhizopus arrhizus]|nr:hypothetical protein G6F60_014163 [Rhizopus arrhizus]
MVAGASGGRTAALPRSINPAHTWPPGIWVIVTWHFCPSGTLSGRVQVSRTLAWMAAAYLAVRSSLLPPPPAAGCAAPLAPAAAVPAALRAAATWRSFCSASLASFSACSRLARISAIFFCFSASALSAA